MNLYSDSRFPARTTMKSIRFKHILSATLVLVACCLALFHFGCQGSPATTYNPNGNTFACKDTTFMLSTTNGGATWYWMTIRGASQVGHRVSDLGIGTNVDGGAFIRFIGGNATVCYPSPTTLGLTNLKYESGETWISSNQLYKSSDYGTHWTTVPGPYTSHDISTFEFGGAGTLLVAYEDSIVRSTDYGHTWDTSALRVPFTLQGADYVHDIQFINIYGDVYAISLRGYVFCSTDGGAKWTAGVQIANASLNATCSSGSSSGHTYQVIVGDGGLIMRSTNDGGTWMQENNQGADLISVTADGAHWWAVGGQEIWKGDADATHWTKYTYPDPRIYFSSIWFFDQNSGSILGY